MKDSNNSLNNEYISLAEATKHCEYSQEYLSLRARQGKLKAKKIGRNWVTKEEWLKQYIAKTKEYNNWMAAKQIQKTKVASVDKPPTKKKPKLQLVAVRRVAPPPNLPVEAKKPKTSFSFRPILIVLLTLTLFTHSIALGARNFHPAKDFVTDIYSLASLGAKTVEFPTGMNADLTQDLNKKIDKVEREIIFNSHILAGAGNIITASTIEMFRESFTVVSQDVTRIGGKGDALVEGIVNVCLFIPETISSMGTTAKEIIRSPKEILAIVIQDLNEMVFSVNRVFAASVVESGQRLEEKASQGYNKMIGFFRFMFHPLD